jgi:hypothetical protein
VTGGDDFSYYGRYCCFAFLKQETMVSCGDQLTGVAFDLT